MPESFGFNWLRSRFFVPIVVGSIVSLALYAGWHLAGIPWHGPRSWLNLALAWVAYLLSLALVRFEQTSPNSRAAWWGLFLVWLGFFPNAPYLVTDLLYLPKFPSELWLSIGLFLCFSLAGLLISVSSLYLVHTNLRERLGTTMAGAAVCIVILLSGVGVFLGRFLRLNTWDLVTNPEKILKDMETGLRNPANHTDPLYFSLGFAGLLGLCYLVFRAIRNGPRSREEQETMGSWE
jgi:uncharacterized membrane protein